MLFNNELLNPEKTFLCNWKSKWV